MDKDCCKRDFRSSGFFSEDIICCDDEFFNDYNIDVNAKYNDRKPMKKYNKDDYDDYGYDRPMKKYNKNDYDDYGYDRPMKKHDKDDWNDCDDDKHNKKHDKDDCNDKNDKKDNNDCCCKKDLEKFFWFLFSPCVKSLINQESITLGSTFFSATVSQIKRGCTCKGLLDFTGTLTPSGGTAVTNNFTTSFCDLISISFQLVPFTSESCCSCTSVNQDTCFRKELLNFLGCCENNCCDIYKDNCCCNEAKAACLSNTISEVNFVLNTTTSSQTLLGLTVIAVNDNIVVVFDGSSYYIICLNAIGAIF